MSYPSITTVLSNKGLDIETASEVQLRESLWEALTIDLPLGLEYLRNLSLISGHETINGDDIDPNSKLGKQIIRIVGCDLPKSVVEEKFNTYFGLYNCCKVASNKVQRPELDIKLQLQKQFTADC